MIPFNVIAEIEVRQPGFFWSANLDNCKFQGKARNDSWLQATPLRQNAESAAGPAGPRCGSNRQRRA